MRIETTDEIFDTLGYVMELVDVPRNLLPKLARLGPRRMLRAGERLVQQGEVSHSIYVVLHGSVRLERRHPDLTEPVELLERKWAEVVGSREWLDGAPSWFSAVAAEPAETLELALSILAETEVSGQDGTVTLLELASRELPTAEQVWTEASFWASSDE